MSRAESSVRGFILQPTYRIEAERPVVHLYGRLESGATFLVRDRRQIPHFYVEAGAAAEAEARGAVRVAATDRVSFAGRPLARVEVRVPADVPPLRGRLAAAGITCHEADVRFAMRLLIDLGIRGSLAISGESRRGQGVDLVFDDPRLEPADWTPTLSVLSFDIETDPQAQRLLALSLHGCGASEVLLITPEGMSCPRGAVRMKSERELIQTFMRRVRELDPDVLTGWNVVDFDLTVLEERANRLGVAFELGRGPGRLRIRPAPFRRAASQAVVQGRLVLDGLALLRGAFVRMDQYGLDFVARQVLGEGKSLVGDDKPAQILEAFRSDRERFVEYSLKDARLVLEILEELRLVELAVERSRLTGMPPDRVSSSIAAFDTLYLSRLGRRGVVAPSVDPGAESDFPTSGGHVLEPRPGLYRNVAVFDFKSLYPSLIRTFQIDPLGFVPQAGGAGNFIMAPNGAAFRRDPSILAELLDELYPRREAAKASGNPVASQAIKILMNSFYGVLGTPACRLYSPSVANAITGFGRSMLLWSKERFEAWGHEVLYGDTDSLFVLTDRDDPEEALELGRELAAALNRELAEHIAATWRVVSRLELQFERLYLRLLLPHVRHAAAGARKRYAGLVEEDGQRQVVFTGMEVVRRDWTPLAKQVQRELYARLFDDEPVESYLESVVAAVRAGRHDDGLVYTKGLGKSLDEYKGSTPPHVVAARKLGRDPGRLISYVMTSAGPEPVEALAHELDREHYVQKQVRPVAEPVLELMGLEFDRVVGDDRQLSLF